MLLSLIFPLGSLIASIVIIIFNKKKIPTGWIVVSALVWLAAVIWLVVNVYGDTDNQWWPSALTVICPLILGIVMDSNTR